MGCNRKGAGGQMTSKRRPAAAVVRPAAVIANSRSGGGSAKPTPAELPVNLATLEWHRSGTVVGSLEIAFVAAGPDRDEDHVHGGVPAHRRDADWVLLRVAGDPVDRVLVYDRNEWMCFLDGVGRGEFDLPAG